MTLIEMLVVVAVLGLLLGLLLPAVQSAREASRRVHCVANLRQIGIAMHAYSDVHGMFPPSQLKTIGNVSTNNFSEFAMLLPFMEQGAIYQSINTHFVQVEWAGAPFVENRTARNTAIATLLCPSDGEPHHLNSYRMNRGRMGGKGPGRGADGPFNIKVLPSQATVTDGLSNTAFVSERVGGSFRAGSRDEVRDVKHPIPDGSMLSSDEGFIPYCLSAEAEGWSTTMGRWWMYDGASTHYSHSGLPNDRRPSCLAIVSHDDGFGLNPPRSYHRGVVNVLFGDGHTQAILDTIQARAWTALGTHDSGD